MEKSVKKRRAGRIALIVLAVLLVLAAGALAFAGNYLFHFALDPQAGGMIDGGDWEQDAQDQAGRVPFFYMAPAGSRTPRAPGSRKTGRTAGSPVTTA